MAYYSMCPNCGARLDPGERCDCREKEKAAQELALQQTANQNLHPQYTARTAQVSKGLA